MHCNPSVPRTVAAPGPARAASPPAHALGHRHPHVKGRQ